MAELSRRKIRYYVNAMTEEIESLNQDKETFISMLAEFKSTLDRGEFDQDEFVQRAYY